MIPKCNLHTHTNFCDGKHSAEEMVLAAIDAGMETLGFSGHSGLPFSTTWAMKQERTKQYQREILRLKDAYKDRLHILLGIEQDLLTGIPDYPYDYVIGSVHCLQPEGGEVMVDHSEEVLLEGAKTYYGGDLYRLCKDYYQRMATVADVTRCDIVGHFDLVTKFNEGGRMFDEQDPRYLRVALEALDALLEKDVVFEINTGAMSRGYRKTPYPSPILLRRIAEKRGNVTITSDAHAKENLLYGFADAVHLARSSGLGCVWVMTRDGWKSRAL
ncbi:MAG: histidinol-phosphatase [Clostridia bacterium]|nr:histidinol-phosphatase [Clostridia bacterium]